MKAVRIRNAVLTTTLESRTKWAQMNFKNNASRLCIKTKNHGLWSGLLKTAFFFLSFTQDDGGGGPGGGGGGGGGGAPIRGGGAWKIHYINRLVTLPGIWCRILIKYTIFVFLVLEWNSLAMEARAGGNIIKKRLFLFLFPTLVSVASKFHSNTKNSNMVY